MESGDTSPSEIPKTSSPTSTTPVIPSTGLTTPPASAPPAPASSLAVLPSHNYHVGASSSSSSVPSIINLNIGNFITLKLDVQSGNFSKWRELMRCVLSMTNVEDHVDHFSEPLQQTAVWRHTDITILLHIYSTLTDALYEVIRGEDNTAHRVWTQLHDFFLPNQPAQAVHLSAEFRILVQGDLRISEYCGRLKALADVDEPVTDRTLTLQLLRGLSRRYQVIATVLPMQIPFPTFNQARSQLLLEELTQDARDCADGAQALAISNGNGGAPPPPNNGGGGNSNSGGRGNGGGRGRGNGGGRGGGNGNGGGRGAAQPPLGAHQMPWMGYFAPWGAPFPPPARAPWVPPNAAGVLRPRPGAPHQAYGAHGGSSQAALGAPNVPSWDPTALYAAMNHLALNGNGGGGHDWYLDSGASSHVTGNAGSGDGDPSHEAQ